jgi:hypothetical protein
MLNSGFISFSVVDPDPELFEGSGTQGYGSGSRTGLENYQNTGTGTVHKKILAI